MMSLLADFGKPCVEKLIDGAIGELRYVCCFTSLAKEFKEEHTRLEAERRTVGQRANVASGSGNDIASNARHWEEEADKLIQEDIETKKKCFFGFCPDCIWRYRRGKKLANKIKDVKRLVEKGEKLENIEIPRHLPDVEFYSSQNYIHFKSRELKYKKLLEALKDENNFMAGLHGMGGAGKTTLAKEVGKELKQSNEFTYVIITTVSYTPDIKKIQDDIAGSLGLDLRSCNDSDRHKKLWSRITNGEKILVILDDVWDRNPPLDFDAIGIPKRDNHKGCKVLVTTRNKRLLNKMDCDEIVKLEVLSEEDSYIMFKRCLGISNSSPKSLIDKGRKIANECKRLPIAIAAVAGSLKGQQSPEEWDVALKSLQNPLSSLQGDDNESLVKIYNCLKFSYDYLKDEKARGLFLLCSTFPEDGKIPVEILTRLAVGTGLFGEDYGSYNDARNQVVVAKNKLLDSCLLLETDEGCVKMHDLVRDAAQLIANQEIRTIDMSHKDPKSLVDREKNTKYLFWKGKAREMFPSIFGGSKLEILIVFFNKDGDGDRVEVPNSFFENMTRLRALFIYVDDQPLSLPQSFRLLTNIRSLLVYNADLGDISVLGNLHCLETLDLFDCKIDELPHAITELEKFKLLQLDVCEIRRNNPFDVIGKCSFLEELYFEDSFNNFCREINFPTLHRYVVTRHPRGHEWDKSLSKCMVLSCDEDEDVDILSEATLKYIMQTAEIIKLDRIGWRWRNLIPEIVPVDQGMNDIFDLYLSNISELQYLIKVDVGSRVPNVFSKLVVLHLDGMEKLEELCNGPISFDSLKALEELSIIDCRNLRSLFKFKLDLSSLKKMTLKDCPLLVSLFQLSTAKSLMMLEKLTIYDCEQLESIITDEKRVEESKEEIELADDGDNDNKKLSSMFPKLKALDIFNCPQLEFILPFLSGDLPVLETISIKGCDKLKYISDQFVELGSLKELELSGLPNFIHIFPESGQLVKGSPSTSRDGFKEPTQLDTIKCNVFSWTHKCCYGLKHKQKLRRTTTNTKIPFVSEDLPQNRPFASIWDRVQCFSRQLQKTMLNITKIELTNVSKIKSVFVLSVTPRMLLETLIIANCDELKHIIVDIGDDSGGNNLGNVFPRLKELKVDNCEQLEYIFGHCADADDHQSHNEIHLHLPELKSLQLCNLPNLVAMCPKHYHTTFPSLVKLQLTNCIQVASKSIIVDFISHASSTTSLDSTTMKCLSGQSQILCNITMIKLTRVSKIKSVFIVSITPRMLLETLIIENCDELKHIIVVDVRDDSGGNNLGNVFPRLKEVTVHNCGQLEYIFGHYVDDHQSHNEIHLHLPELKSLELCFLPSLVAMCPKQYHTTFPSLVKLQLHYLIQVAIKSTIGDFISHASSTSLDSTTMKCLSGQSQILCNITMIELSNVSKIKSVFILSTARRMLLETLTIRDCDELKHIIVVDVRDDSGGNNLGNVFPRLKEITVHNCGQLEYIFGQYVDDHQSHNEIHLHLPELKILLLANLPSLVAMCPKQFHTTFPPMVKLELKNCIQVAIKSIIGDFISHASSTSLNSTTMKCLEETTDQSIQEASTSETRSKPPTQLISPKSKQESFKTSVEEGTTLVNVKKEVGYGNISIPSLSTSQTNDQSVKDGNLTTETNKDFSVGVEVQAAFGHELTSSQEFLDESSTSQQCLMSQQHLLGENDTTSKPSQENNCLEETKDQSIQEALISEKAITTAMQSFKRSDEQGTTLDNVKTGTTSTHLESISSSSKPLVTFEHQTSLQVKDDEIRVSEPKPSPTTSSLASQSISTPYEGNPPQIMENPSSSSLITWELIQLVSKKHLASENLSLLTDFLIKHPSVHLKDNSRSNKYKGHAYNCLAELLIFLQTHSILDVVGSSHSKFVELLQDARSFEFDKDWLDGVEKRVLFPDLHLSQDALEKLLHSKQQVTKEIEMLNLKIGIFTQHVEELKHQLASSEASLKNIIQQEARVLESRAALSVPLGY